MHKSESVAVTEDDRKTEQRANSACNDLLSVFAFEIAGGMSGWMAEGDQMAQQAQDDGPYWEHVTTKIRDYLERAYDDGWYAAAGQAINVCNARADRGVDWGTPRSNEAAKCALQIEHELVTANERETRPPCVGGDRESSSDSAAPAFDG